MSIKDWFVHPAVIVDPVWGWAHVLHHRVDRPRPGPVHHLHIDLLMEVPGRPPRIVRYRDGVHPHTAPQTFPATGQILPVMGDRDDRDACVVLWDEVPPGPPWQWLPDPAFVITADMDAGVRARYRQVRELLEDGEMLPEEAAGDLWDIAADPGCTAVWMWDRPAVRWRQGADGSDAGGDHPG